MRPVLRENRNHYTAPPEDDGRTLAPMNVEGMPWHTERPKPPENPEAEPLRGKALRRYMLGAVGVGLVITAVFGAAGALFILFCTNIWFH